MKNFPIFDIIYTPKMTRFLTMAAESSGKIITGDRMFLWQALEQAKLFTGRDDVLSILEAVADQVGFGVRQ